MIPVNEVFETIQGEARWTGTPATFIRLQGCDVGCPWCDTKHTWKVDPAQEVAPLEMLGKEASSPTYAMMPAAALVEEARRHRPKHVVITGGEPCVYDLRPLTLELARAGFLAQIETSGTQEIRVARSAWVTLSPKIGMPGGFTVRPDAIRRADEIKMPVGSPRDVRVLRDLLDASPDYRGDVWLQPLSRSEKATALCVEAAQANGWRVSIQVHAFIGVR
jgi:7-carboxy-7-deazaguanine synthase